MAAMDAHLFGYDQEEKKKCRSKLIGHAVRCLTTVRYTSACVERGHVRRVWEQLKESGESRAFFSSKQVESIEAEIGQWEKFHESKVQVRKPSDLSVCYLGGDNPINDLQVLVDNGVLPQNVWTVEKESTIFKTAWESIRRSNLRNVRSFKGDILNFLKDFEGNFDIIYFDACGTLPAMSDKANTLKFIGYVFLYNKLSSPGALITNFSFPPEGTADEERDQIRKLSVEYLKYRLVNTQVNKNSPDANAEHLNGRTDEENYGDYITYQVIDSAYLYIPALRMLSSTRSGQACPLWDQMFKSRKDFLDFLKNLNKSFASSESSVVGQSSSESTTSRESLGASESTAASESSTYRESLGASESTAASESSTYRESLGASESTAASESSTYRESLGASESTAASESSTYRESLGAIESTAASESSTYRESLGASESTAASESTIACESLGVSESTAASESSTYRESLGASESTAASESSTYHESLGASESTACAHSQSSSGESSAGSESPTEVFLTLKDTSQASYLFKCGFALEENRNRPFKTWVSEIFPDWRSTSNLKDQRLSLMFLTHLLSYLGYFISKFTNGNFQKKCIESLFNALHMHPDMKINHRGTLFPSFYNAVDIDKTTSLVAGLLYGQMAYPSFPVVDKLLRLHYTAKKRQMFSDVFIFDKCRYVYEQFPSVDCACFAISEPGQQMVFRMVVDGLRKHLEGICLEDVFPSCHVASRHPVPNGVIDFPNSCPNIPKRQEVTYEVTYEKVKLPIECRDEQPYYVHACQD